MKLVFEDKNKKLSLYVNGEYICSSTQYKTAKEFKDKVVNDGFVKYAGINSIGSSTPKDIKKIEPNDKVVVKYESLSEKRINEQNSYYSRGAQTLTLDEFEKELKYDMSAFLEWAAEEYGRKEAEAKLKKMLSTVIRLTSTI